MKKVILTLGLISLFNLYNCKSTKEIEKTIVQEQIPLREKLETIIRNYKTEGDTVLYTTDTKEIVLNRDKQGDYSVWPIQKFSNKPATKQNLFPVPLIKEVAEYVNNFKIKTEDIKKNIENKTQKETDLNFLEKNLDNGIEYLFKYKKPSETVKFLEEYFKKLEEITENIRPTSKINQELLEKFLNYVNYKKEEVKDKIWMEEKIYSEKYKNKKVIVVYIKFKPKNLEDKFGNYGPRFDAVTLSNNTLKNYILSNEQTAINWNFGQKIIFCSKIQNTDYYEAKIIYDGVGTEHSKKKINKELTKKLIENLPSK